MGKLPCTGNGTPVTFHDHASSQQLQSTSLEHNKKLLSSLREDPHAAELLAQTQADVDLHRMTPLVHSDDADLHSIRLAKRFAVEQGRRPDGSVKLRAIDNETGAGVNPCCEPTERLRTDGADMLVALMQFFYTVTCCVPHIFKADMDAAYRRVPLRPADQWAAHIAFRVGLVTFISGHLCMPFGAVASVHAWDRVGSLLCHLGRRLLGIPLLRYVDDYLSCDRPACVSHAMLCSVRLIRLLLGPTAISQRKLGHGSSLIVLGLVFSATVQHGISCWPSADKISKWIRILQEAVQRMHLSPGRAGKLA